MCFLFLTIVTHRGYAGAFTERERERYMLRCFSHWSLCSHSLSPSHACLLRHMRHESVYSGGVVL